MDFLLDKYFGTTVVLDRVRTEALTDPATDPEPPAPGSAGQQPIPARHRAHVAFVDAEIAAFPERCRALLGPGEPADRIPIALNRIANELFALTVTLGRAATLTAAGDPDAGDLADVYATAARHRLADWWRQAGDTDEPDVGQIAGRWLDEFPHCGRCAVDGRPAGTLTDVLLPEPLLGPPIPSTPEPEDRP